jgi:segregation and condensation protein A
METPASAPVPGYHVQTDFFEGPFDLLLHLIRKNKLNIMDIRISVITAEYLAHLDSGLGINPSRESDFLMTAATLIYIKSRSLLPRPEETAEETPERQLVRSLIEHEKVQKLSRMLQEMEYTELMLWRREAVGENFENREFTLREVSPFQLAEIFFSIVRKKEQEDFLYLASKNYSIEAKQQEILMMLERDGFIDFGDYTRSLDTLEEILVSFFTLLEMVKRQQLVAVQKELFGPIHLWRVAEARLTEH